MNKCPWSDPGFVDAASQWPTRVAATTRPYVNIKQSRSRLKGMTRKDLIKYSKYGRQTMSPIHIPNRTFLVRFGGISGEFGRAMVHILARRSRAKIPMARPNEPDMPQKRTKKIQLGIYRTQIQPKI